MSYNPVLSGSGPSHWRLPEGLYCSGVGTLHRSQETSYYTFLRLVIYGIGCVGYFSIDFHALAPFTNECHTSPSTNMAWKSFLFRLCS